MNCQPLRCCSAGVPFENDYRSQRKVSGGIGHSVSVAAAAVRIRVFSRRPATPLRDVR